MAKVPNALAMTGHVQAINIKPKKEGVTLTLPRMGECQNLCAHMH